MWSYAMGLLAILGFALSSCAEERAGQSAVQVAPTAEVAGESEPETAAPLDVATLFTRHEKLRAVSGSFRDYVTRLDQAEESEPNILAVTFWLQRPDQYHFIVQEDDSEDRQHYLSDGVQRWQVEVVLDNAIVDLQDASSEDPFARIQQLMHLDQAALAKDFQWTEVQPIADLAVGSYAGVVFPEAWRFGLLLQPHSPEMRSEVRSVLLAISAQGALSGLVIDDAHNNRRMVEILRLEEHETLDAALFRWAEEE